MKNVANATNYLDIDTKELEISQMTVSRIEKKIVEKLRKEYEKQLEKKNIKIF